jgi:hypothetical protein
LVTPTRFRSGIKTAPNHGPNSANGRWEPGSRVTRTLTSPHARPAPPPLKPAPARPGKPAPLREVRCNGSPASRGVSRPAPGSIPPPHATEDPLPTRAYQRLTSRVRNSCPQPMSTKTKPLRTRAGPQPAALCLGGEGQNPTSSPPYRHRPR